jgi:hypothetical protein
MLSLQHPSGDRRLEDDLSPCTRKQPIFRWVAFLAYIIDHHDKFMYAPRFTHYVTVQLLDTSLVITEPCTLPRLSTQAPLWSREVRTPPVGADHCAEPAHREPGSRGLLSNGVHQRSCRCQMHVLTDLLSSCDLRSLLPLNTCQRNPGLTGPIPSTRSMQLLHILSLYDDNFTGPLPNDLADAQRLSAIDISINQ